VSDKFRDHFSNILFKKLPFVKKVIYYVINSNYRKATNLTKWIEKQVENPSQELINLANEIKDYENMDKQIIEVLKFVFYYIKYKSDRVNWNANEYWATANEIIKKRADDCDGGATLSYVLARLKGIPAKRLVILTGNVGKNNIGHCWLGYFPNNYPFNLWFMDWCYYPTFKYKFRDLYFIKNKQIIRYAYDYKIQNFKKIDSKYNKIWFGFNEEISFTSMWWKK